MAINLLCKLEALGLVPRTTGRRSSMMALGERRHCKGAVGSGDSALTRWVTLGPAELSIGLIQSVTGDAEQAITHKGTMTPRS